MRLGIVGAGFVGRRLGEYFLSLGHQVTFYDISDEVLRELSSRGYSVTDDMKEIASHDMSFISVPTPTKDTGEIDLFSLTSALNSLGMALSKVKNPHLVVLKSTVLPGTTETIVVPTLFKLSGRSKDTLGVIFNPEFITESAKTWTKENSFVVNPDNEHRIVIGEGDEKSWGDLFLKEIYPNTSLPVIRTDYRTAEMIKYASNLALACRISFWNEIFLVCKELGIDSNIVAQAASYDPRIGKYGTVHGKAFGGKCLPKDLKAFITFAEKFRPVPLLKAVQEINEYMKKHYGVREKRTVPVRVQ